MATTMVPAAASTTVAVASITDRSAALALLGAAAGSVPRIENVATPRIPGITEIGIGGHLMCREAAPATRGMPVGQCGSRRAVAENRCLAVGEISHRRASRVLIVAIVGRVPLGRGVTGHRVEAGAMEEGRIMGGVGLRGAMRRLENRGRRDWLMSVEIHVAMKGLGNAEARV